MRVLNMGAMLFMFVRSPCLLDRLYGLPTGMALYQQVWLSRRITAVDHDIVQTR